MADINSSIFLKLRSTNDGSTRTVLRRLKDNQPSRFALSSTFGKQLVFSDSMNEYELLEIFPNREFSYKYNGPLAIVGEIEPQENWGIEYLHGRALTSNGLDGTGVKVAIIDTGLDPSHQCFSNMKIVQFVDIDRGDGTITVTDPFDSQWHGTFCAAILAGEPVDGLARGIAPKAEYYVAKVFNRFNSSRAAVQSAIEWCIEMQVNIISMSMGAPNQEDIWLDVIQNYLKTGGILVAGIGNDFGGDAPTIAPANYPFEGVISVGAHDIEDNIWSKSGGGIVDWSKIINGNDCSVTNKPEVVGPGVSITSIGENSQYRLGSGTSFATPHVAGLLACLWSGELRSERIQVIAKFKKLLRDSGHPGIDTRFGSGLIKVKGLFSVTWLLGFYGFLEQSF